MKLRRGFAARSLGITAVMLFAAVGRTTAQQQVDWRFGFEDTFSQLGGLLNDEQSNILLQKLAYLVENQQAGGDININGFAGGWASMQPLATSKVDFTRSDKLIRLLGNYGFSCLWNLRTNALWATAGNEDCYAENTISSCAPDAEHEQDLYNYIYAVVERYDGDGVKDMGYETPDDPADDLKVPVRFYLMTGEIEFAGATPEPGEGSGYGDSAKEHFWADNIDNLLRTHRIIYQAIHDADPSGNTKLVSSGGIFWDLYCDFPDWPDVEGPTVTARINGDNNHNAVYKESFDRLRRMLSSFGDDGDGIECDYIGWHPHMPWREIDQTFAFIRKYAGDKPIYIDDMWANIFLQDRADAPGNTLFTGGGKAIEGDFPNELVESYSQLRNGVIFNTVPGARDWYLGRHSRQITKAYVSAFGEGAERVGFSGIADFGPDRLSLLGFINLLGTAGEGFAEKPGYRTYRLLVDKLHDFTDVEELDVGSSPLTRVYRFTRAGRGPLYVAWSETGDAPPGLDYRIPTGETVSFPVESTLLDFTYIFSEPEAGFMNADQGVFTRQLGYAPILIEPVVQTDAPEQPDGSDLAARVYPNPSDGRTALSFHLPAAGPVTITIFDALGRQVAEPVTRAYNAGENRMHPNVDDLSDGLYLCRVQWRERITTAVMVLAR